MEGFIFYKEHCIQMTIAESCYSYCKVYYNKQ